MPKKLVETPPPEPTASGAFEPPTLTVTEFAARVGMSVRTVMRYLAAGSLPPATYFGRRMRFRASDAARVAAEGPSLPGSFEVPDSPNRDATKRASVKRLARISRRQHTAMMKKKKGKKPASKKVGAK